MPDAEPRWEWDPDKDETNRRVHGIRFESAMLVFDDMLAVTVEDPYPHEQRWQTIGIVGPSTLMVIHTWPERNPLTGEQIGRIVSARKATNRERRAYEEGAF